MNTHALMLVEELEARLELAAFADPDPADPDGSCSGSCCLTWGCGPSAPPPVKKPEDVL